VGTARVGKRIGVSIVVPAGARASFAWVLTPKRKGRTKPRTKVVGHGATVKAKRSWKGGTLAVRITVTKPGHVPYVASLRVRGRVR
jgi:hypothetical protein